MFEREALKEVPSMLTSILTAPKYATQNPDGREFEQTLFSESESDQQS